MCLSCYLSFKSPENLEIEKEHPSAPWTAPVVSKEEFKEIVFPKWLNGKRFNKHFGLMNPVTNEEIKLTDAAQDEIIEHSMGLILTGVDLSYTIWALQWPNGYKPKNFN